MTAVITPAARALLTAAYPWQIFSADIRTLLPDPLPDADERRCRAGVPS
nr:hypothetical protein [Cellulomonas hominis]